MFVIDRVIVGWYYSYAPVPVQSAVIFAVVFHIVQTEDAIKLNYTLFNPLAPNDACRRHLLVCA